MFENLKKHIEKRIPITDEEFAIYSSMLQVKHLKKREFLVKTGEVSTHQAYINKGCMCSYLTDKDGDQHVIQFGFEDWYIGDMSSFITGKPADYSIEALEDCELFVFHRDDAETLYARLPQLERYFRILIQHAFIAMQSRIVATMSDSAEERYLALIKRYPGMELRVAQHHIASYLGITPEALSRIRRKLVKGA